MASYVVIILLPWNGQKVIVLSYSRSLGERIHTDDLFYVKFLNITEIFLCASELISLWMHVENCQEHFWVKTNLHLIWRSMHLCVLPFFLFFFFFSIFGTTLWDYINKKTEEGQRSLSISIYPDKQLPVNSRDRGCTIFHQSGFQTNPVHMLVGISCWILKRMLFLIKAAPLNSTLKPNSWALSHHNNSYLATLISVQAPFHCAFTEPLCSLCVIVQLWVPLCVPTIVEVSGASQDGETILLCLTIATCIRNECGFW